MIEDTYTTEGKVIQSITMVYDTMSKAPLSSLPAHHSTQYTQTACEVSAPDSCATCDQQPGQAYPGLIL